MAINLSKEKRDKLLEKIQSLREFVSNSSNVSDELLSSINEIESEINNKKYGLIFEEHRENVDQIVDNNIPVLTESNKHLIPSGKVNFLIEGDNLASLLLLEKTHKEAVDVIYIDPPYNTGKKDFMYNDKVVDSVDAYKHSKWLSFMNRRLKLAHKLLAKNGLIFISIDDNEQANLKILCDDIFGENNFVAQLIWKKKQGGGNDSSYFVVEHEYILCYAKNIESSKIYLDKNYELDDKLYPFKDEKGEYGLVTLDKSSIRSSDSLIFDITGPDGTIYRPRVVKGKQACWRWSQKKVLEEYESLVFKNGKVYTKYYRPEGVQPRSLLTDVRFGRTETGKEEIKEILGNSLFTYPKPVELIKHLLSITTTGDEVVLDFFAGSGTTGQAVMELNKEDGGNRKFILCTNNENNICEEVTFERMKKVIENEDYQEGLKYFKVDYVETKDKVYYEYANELLVHIKELVELENAIDFKNNVYVSIALTDEEMDDICADVTKLEKLQKLYVGHDILISSDQIEKLNNNGIEVVTIPDYYYSER